MASWVAGLCCLLAALQAGETWARPVSLSSDTSLEVTRHHAREAIGSSGEGGLTSAWAAFVAFVSGGRATASARSGLGDGTTCACSVCVRITLRAMTLSPQQQQQPEQLGGSGTGSARLDSGSCGRVQRLLVSDLTQAAAHLGIHVTQPFAPAACDLEPDQVAAAAGQQGASQAGSGAAARVVSAVSVCGRVQEGPAASSALALHLQEAAARYYAAAELAVQDLYTCPPAMAGMSVSVDLVRQVVPLAQQPAGAQGEGGAGAHAHARHLLAARAEEEAECVTTVHELSCMRRKQHKL